MYCTTVSSVLMIYVHLVTLSAIPNYVMHHCNQCTYYICTLGSPLQLNRTMYCTTVIIVHMIYVHLVPLYSYTELCTAPLHCNQCTYNICTFGTPLQLHIPNYALHHCNQFTYNICTFGSPLQLYRTMYYKTVISVLVRIIYVYLVPLYSYTELCTTTL